MRATAVSYVILGALRGGPKSGYDIKQLVDNATRFFWA
ncbi:MAG: PadR family transcriptional regulator, partial [Actinobacteria bacterium]|nr:PadR family transcriptional regulator [Actinomycetota bacterium]